MILKKYVILSSSIFGMGGGQMYQRNKMEWMKRICWEVNVLSASKGVVVIPEFKEYENNYIPELSMLPYLLTQKQIQNTIDKIISIVGNLNPESVIESNSKTVALWGEMLAEKFNAKNFVFILDEKIGSLDNCLINFLRFKRNRHEIYGIKKETYEMLYHEEFSGCKYSFVLPLICNNVVENYQHELIAKIPSANLKIASIGRLDKPYIRTLVNEIAVFASNYAPQKVVFLMIGDSPNESDVKYTHRILDPIENLIFIQHGALFPIPLELIRLFDVFISSAGSARVSGDRGVPTITIDARDFCAIGVYNKTTQRTVYRENEPCIPISKAIEDLLKDNLYLKYRDFNPNYKREMDYSIFEEHISSIEQFIQDGKYFNVYNVSLSFSRKVEKAVYNILGFKVYQKIKKYVFVHNSRYE